MLQSERWAEEVEERALVLLGRPPGWRPDCPPGPLCFRLLGWPMDYMLFSWAEPWCGSWSLRGPGFMNLTGAPEPPGDLSRIVRGIFFVLPVGARERTRGCSPRAPGQFGQNRLGGFLRCQRERFFALCRWVRASAPAGVAPEPPGGSGRTIWGCCFSGHVCF